MTDNWMGGGWQGVGYTIGDVEELKAVWGEASVVKSYSNYTYYPAKMIIPPAEDWSPKPHQCPLCGKQKHSAPLTRNLHNALEGHALETYNWREDNSEILCPYPGEGPARDLTKYRKPSQSQWWVAAGLEELTATIQSWLGYDLEPWQTATLSQWYTPPKAIKPAKVGPTKHPETQINVEYKAIEKPHIHPKELEGFDIDLQWFDEPFELPDMKADWDSLIKQANKKTHHYILEESK